MKSLVAIVVIAGAGLIGAVSSQAMPVVPLHQDQASTVIPVAQGCGPGMHRGPYGHCRPLYSCPPGWHSGPFGRRCFRN
jgi:hypothetical protein